MKRITTFDRMRGVYVIKPDATGNHIQRLGMLEDRDEARACVYTSLHEPQCCNCGYLIADNNYTFCPWCGQRLQTEVDEDGA